MRLPSPRILLIAFLSAALSTIFLLLQLQASPQNYSPIPTQLPGHDAILMGTDWYPEQWPASRWESDVSMMETAHLAVVRLAGAAWSRPKVAMTSNG